MTDNGDQAGIDPDSVQCIKPESLCLMPVISTSNKRDALGFTPVMGGSSPFPCVLIVETFTSSKNVKTIPIDTDTTAPKNNFLGTLRDYNNVIATAAPCERNAMRDSRQCRGSDCTVPPCFIR